MSSAQRCMAHAGGSGGYRDGLVILPQSNPLCGDARMLFRLCRIVFARGVDVFMPEHISNEIDVPSFMIKHGAVGTAQLVRRDLLERRGDGGIFFDQIFHAAHRHAPVQDCRPAAHL